MAAALTNLGVESEHAEQIAAAVEAGGEAKNALEGTSLALKRLQPPSKVKATKTKLMPEPVYEPGDLRNAIKLARTEGTNIYFQLQRMGVVCDIAQVLPV